MMQTHYINVYNPFFILSRSSTDEAHWSFGPIMTATAPNDTSKEIVCSVCANPQPTFLWTFKKKSLRKGIQVVGNKIILDHVTRDDFGVYQCMANNIVNGEDRMAVFEVTLVERGKFYSVCVILQDQNNLESLLKIWCSISMSDYNFNLAFSVTLFVLYYTYNSDYSQTVSFCIKIMQSLLRQHVNLLCLQQIECNVLCYAFFS